MANDPRADALIKQLRAGGDERYGGSRPLGGKAAAGTVDYSAGGGEPNVRAPGPGYPGNLAKSERDAYDAYMNRKEEELQDIEGKDFGSTYERAKRLPKLKK